MVARRRGSWAAVHRGAWRVLTASAPLVGACGAGAAALLAAGCGDSGSSGGSGAAAGGAGSTAGTGGAAGSTAGTGGAAGSAGAGGAVFGDEHPRIYLNPTVRARLTAALATPTAPAQRFRAMVDRQLSDGNVYAFAAWNAALMGALGQGARYCTYAIAEVEATVTAEEALIASGERAEVAFDSYLEVGDRIGDVMLVYDWCWAEVTPAQRQRWAAYAQQAVWNVWHHETATWGGQSYPWSGWSVDNPVNNYYFSFLRATMLFGLAARGEHAEAAGWVDFFRTTKIEQELVPTYRRDLVGGGSREGTGYGVAMMHLFRLYDWWAESTGERLADLTPHSRETLPWLVHAIVPTLDRVAPIGDHARDSTAALFDYHRDYLQVLAALHPESPVGPAARGLLAASSVPEMSQGFMLQGDLLYGGGAEAPLTGLHTAWHSPGTGHFFARTAFTPDATWLAAIAGPYTESHAHRDQGSFLLYREGWLAWDANIASRSGIRQEEELHNLVRFEDGGATVRQREGAGPAVVYALHHDPELTVWGADLTPAHGTGTPLVRWERELVRLGADVVVVFDRTETARADVRRVWQLNLPAAPALGGGTLTFTGSPGRLTAQAVHPAASWSVVDWAAADTDMSGGARAELDVTGATDVPFLVVLGLGSTTVTVTPRDDATHLGVDLAWGADVATLRFARAARGGTLRWTSGTTARFDGALPATVASTPEQAP